MKPFVRQPCILLNKDIYAPIHWFGPSWNVACHCNWMGKIWVEVSSNDFLEFTLTKCHPSFEKHVLNTYSVPVTMVGISGRYWEYRNKEDGISPWGTDSLRLEVGVRGRSDNGAIKYKRYWEISIFMALTDYYTKGFLNLLLH